MAIRSEHVGSLLQQRSSVPAFVVLATILVAATLGLWTTLTSLSGIWLDMLDYRHGLLIVAISLLWLFRRRALINASAGRAEPKALALLAIAVLAWTVAYRANSEIMQQLLVPVILQFAVLAALGTQVARLTLAPFAYLYFAVPVWEYALPLLQWLTTQVTEAVLGVIGVPTQVDGHTVTIPEGTFEIVEGCSGKRYLVIGLAFATLVAAINEVRGRGRIILLSSAIAAALVTNWLRVAVVIYAGHVSNMQHYLVAKEHLSFGYLLFIPLMASILLIARRVGPPHAGEPATDAPKVTMRPSAAIWSATSVLLLTPLLPVARSQPLHVPVSLLPLPVLTDTWQGPLPPSSRWQPRYSGAAAERRAAYRSADGTVEVYYNVYGPQSPGHELVHFGNTIVPAEWSVTSRSRLPVRKPAITVARDVDGGTWLIAQDLRVGGTSTAIPAMAQLLYGIAATWRPVPSGTVVLAAACEPDCDRARANLLDFHRAHGERFAQLIPGSFEESP